MIRIVMKEGDVRVIEIRSVKFRNLSPMNLKIFRQVDRVAHRIILLNMKKWMKL